MKHSVTPTIHRLLGSNNLLVVVADGYNAAAADQTGHFLADMALTLAKELSSYAVVNAKYKREIMDLADVGTILTRPKVRDAFLVPIKKFKDEIENNGLPPLLLLFQCLADAEQGEAMVVFGYGQGERASAATPHRPTIPASLLAKIRIAIEDQHLRTALAPVDSPYCGRDPQHLNQLFKQKIYCADWYAPEVRSILISIRPDLVGQQETAESIGRMLAPAFAQFGMAMSLVRNIDINNIDVTSPDDLRYIFRLSGDQRYTDLLRESYIEELAGSIDRNGLLHPLVLLKKDDGRYKILCGFRRFQALKRIKRSSVEAKVYQEADFSPEDFFNISLAENTKRRNLNPIEIGNFLESASTALGLSNTELAERFGGTLGIGKPGQNVSHSTIHKYRKVNQIRLRGESPEMISDVINEKLQFSIAAEVLAPIKNSADRDALYLHVIKPLAPTRPQLAQLLAQFEQLAPQLGEAIALNKVQAALVKALASPQPAATLIKLLRQDTSSPEDDHPEVFKAQVDSVRTRFFGKQANKKDFNILPSSPTRRNEVIVHFRIRQGETLDTLKRLCHALEQSDPFSWTKQTDDS